MLVLPSNNPTNMSTDPGFKCVQCGKYKLSGEYGTRQRGDSHTQKGARLASCLYCSTAAKASQRRRIVKSNSDCPAMRLEIQLNTASQFIYGLPKCASANEIHDSMRV